MSSSQQYQSHYSSVNTHKKVNYNLQDFQRQKDYIGRERQWLNGLSNHKQKNNQNNQNNKHQDNLANKPFVSHYREFPKNEYLKLNDYNRQDSVLQKTVKRKSIPNNNNNKNQFVNIVNVVSLPDHYSNKREQESRSRPQIQQIIQNQSIKHNNNNNYNNIAKSVHSRVQISQPNNNDQPDHKNIMTIEQIKGLQRSSNNQQNIHKINSASKKKLRTSGSKDSKGQNSLKGSIQKCSMISKPATDRYNKYMQNQLVSVNIDLRKDVIDSSIGVIGYGGRKSNNYSANCNYGDYGDRSQKQPVANKSIQDSKNSAIKPASSITKLNCNQQNQNQNYQPLTYRDHLPREEVKQSMSSRQARSKSTLSKYSQIKDIKNQIKPNCQEQLNCKSDSNREKNNTEQIINLKKDDGRKIHSLCYSSNKKSILLKGQELNQAYNFTKNNQRIYKPSTIQIVRDSAKSGINHPKDKQIGYNLSGNETSIFTLSKNPNEPLKKKPIRLTINSARKPT